MANVASVSSTDLDRLAATRTDSSSTTKKNKVERVTVRLTGELGNGIRELEEITSASSPSEVVRRAIIVYHTLVKQKLDGNEPQILVRSGKEQKVIPIFL